MDDWRLQGQERHLAGVELQWKKYQQYREGWDHDHCEFCNAKFSVDILDDLKFGYATAGDYYWICAACFEDFKERFAWKLIKGT